MEDIGNLFHGFAVVLQPYNMLLMCIGILLVIIGMQPPNEIAVPIVSATVGVMVVLWFGYIRRHFPGPPANVLHELSDAEQETATIDP